MAFSSPACAKLVNGRYAKSMKNVEQVSPHVYYLPGGVNSIIVQSSPGQALLIDTGQDKSYGKALRRACSELGLKPIAIINTHAHADHYGGNAYLLQHFSIPVYAPAFEASIMENPYLEPVYLMNGAKPLAELMNKWLLAPASPVSHHLHEGRLRLDGLELDIIDTSGHAHQQVSVLVDGVLIAADALFGKEVLDKYPLPFGQDIGQQIASATKLSELPINMVIPGHGQATDNPSELIQRNLESFEDAASVIRDSCKACSTDEVLVSACQSLGVHMTDLPRYYLNRCVISAYLTYLRDEGQVRLELRNNQLLWTSSDQG